MKFKNWLLKEEIEFLSIEEYSNLDYKTRLFFEGQQETFALSLLNNDQNLLNQLKPHIQEKHLPVAAYWLSKGTNINQVLEIMKAYIELADKNIIKANVTKTSITLDYKNKKQEPMPNFIVFVNTVDGIQQRQRFNNPRTEDIQIDAENLKILHQQNNITVYEANSPQACVTLGRGQSFCISKPAGTMWQSYRDSKTSTFYFVKDQNKDLNDPLRLVVIDITKRGIELTDTNNTTGNIAEYGETTEGYFQYLRKMGVPTEIFKNIPKSSEEEAEQRLLGKSNMDLNWFKGLNIFQQSKYIGRGHRFSDEQFDYLWNENEQKLLNQYASIGSAVNSYQLNKFISKTSLKNSYFKAREQAVSGGNDKYTYDEYLTMTPEQQEVAKNKKQVDLSPLDIEMVNASSKGDLDAVKSLIEKGAIKFNASLVSAARKGHINIVKYLFEKTANNSNDIVIRSAIEGGHLDVVEYLIEKSEYDLNDIMARAALGGKLEIVKLMIEKGANDFNEAMIGAAKYGHLEIVKLMIEKGANKFNEPIQAAMDNGQRDMVDYIKQVKSDQSQPAQQPAQPVRNPWLSRMRSKIGI